MNLGFIGTGKIASSVITGICKSKIKFKRIIISERNKKTSKTLKRKFKKINISKKNTKENFFRKDHKYNYLITIKIGSNFFRILCKFVPCIILL